MMADAIHSLHERIDISLLRAQRTRDVCNRHNALWCISIATGLAYFISNKVDLRNVCVASHQLNLSNENSELRMKN